MIENNQHQNNLEQCIYRIGRLAENIFELQHLLNAILNEVQNMLECTESCIAILENDEFRFITATGEASDILKEFRLPKDKGIPGKILRGQNALLINHPEKEPDWDKNVQTSSGVITKNIAAAPLIRRGKFIGVIEALNSKKEEGFDEQQLHLLQIFADQVASFIDMNQELLARQESDRLAAFGLGVADAAHTLKGRLTKITFPMSVLEQQLKQNWTSDQEQVWGILKNGIEGIKNITLEMLAYTNPCELERESVNIKSFLDELVYSYLGVANEKGIEIHVSVESENLTWLIDKNKVYKSIENLVSNAIKAIGGKDNATIWIEAFVVSDSLKLDISDNGPGIPEKLKNTLFDPFVTGDPGKGNGLGLANVKKCAVAHGGSIELLDQENKGAFFRMSLK